MANTKRELIKDPQREIDAAEKARENLQGKINRLNEKGWHNQFDYANYGVQYNPIYDKSTGRVKSLGESGLTVRQYTHLAKMMGSSPELTVEWNIERARKIGGEVFDTYAKNHNIIDTKDARDEFIRKYVEAVKKYHQDDEDFNYEVIKSLFTDLPQADMERAQEEHHESMKLGMRPLA